MEGEKVWWDVASSPSENSSVSHPPSSSLVPWGGDSGDIISSPWGMVGALLLNIMWLCVLQLSTYLGNIKYEEGQHDEKQKYLLWLLIQSEIELAMQIYLFLILDHEFYMMIVKGLGSLPWPASAVTVLGLLVRYSVVVTSTVFVIPWNK